MTETKEEHYQTFGHQIANYVIFSKQNQLCSVKGVTLEVYSLIEVQNWKHQALVLCLHFQWIFLQELVVYVRRSFATLAAVKWRQMPDTQITSATVWSRVEIAPSVRLRYESPSAVHSGITFPGGVLILVYCRLVQEFWLLPCLPTASFLTWATFVLYQHLALIFDEIFALESPDVAASCCSYVASWVVWLRFHSSIRRMTQSRPNDRATVICIFSKIYIWSHLDFSQPQAACDAISTVDAVVACIA